MQVINLGSDSRNLNGNKKSKRAKPIKGLLMSGILLWAAVTPPAGDLQRNNVNMPLTGHGKTVIAVSQLRRTEGQ